MSPGSTSLGEAMVAIIAVGTLPVGILTALFFGIVPAAVVFVVGWLFLVPIVAILQDTVGEPDPVDDAVSQAMADAISDRTGDSSGAEDPLEKLRERYAAGELDDVEFERKVERLLETEDIDVPDGVSIDRDPDSDGSSSRTTDREREPEVE